MIGTYPTLIEDYRRRSVTAPRTVAELAPDQQAFARSMLTQEGGCAAFVESVVICMTHGFALHVVDIGDEDFAANITPMMEDAKILLGSVPQEEKIAISDRTLDRRDEDTNQLWMGERHVD